jgi:predicted amidohydrolase
MTMSEGQPMGNSVKVAVVQMEPVLGDLPANLRSIIAGLEEAASGGARLVVFPECASSGYIFESREEALDSAIELDSPMIQELVSACRKRGVHCVVGVLERTKEGKLHNTAVLLGPDGLLARYRKVHLPGMGLDRFVDAGQEPFAVQEIRDLDLRVGMLICYDGVFPEPPRVLGLKGADAVILPTNWPKGMEHGAEHIPPVRALENTMYFLASNRVGKERYVSFVGRSSIAGPGGEILAKAGTEEPDVIYATIEPALARAKHIVRIPGKAEIDRFRDRRPEFYQNIVE